ncbi:ATP-binding cassette domain-containing protein [Haloarcula rubripromontorii]|uniref:Probable branched-chain amino acid transport ATP-binding protein LivG n=1 Tax=Haloarcula rubripromontorii TaxID=1705562 RepID=A0A847U150_9EURY|nr:ABC transporter ATP-binding protein [Haloarcula rubripromontorii]NLV06659.1 ATP-binding cassette domain-containing protein [Haloarcula rubripromontorii]
MSEPDAAPRQEAAVTSDAIESPLLEVDGLRKEFGGVVAVDGATFSIAEGSLTGLIGPNGAGKSTTFNCITGIHEPTGGRVTFDGQNITGLAPYTLANRGLVRTFQIARELSDMTVIENVMLAPGGQVGESVVRSVTPGLRDDVIADETAVRDRAWETLEFFEIDHLAHENAGNLSGGQRKLLEMARVLMTDPEMILLDEPLAGVNPTLEEKLLERIHELRQEQGLTFLLVEHDMDVIMNNCEHIIVMHQGSVLAEGDAETIKSDERVLEAYLGGDV